MEMGAAWLRVSGTRALLLDCLDLLWPPVCAACGNPSGRKPFCEICRIELPVITGARCEVCSQPFPAAEGSVEFVCANCRERRFHFVCSLSPLRAHGKVREMIHRLKYGGERWLARPLAMEWEACKDDSRIPWREIAGFVPVPLHPLRRRERGYNQAGLLAEHAARLFSKPVLPVLKRARVTETQTHFDRDHRMQNLRNAFAMRHNGDMPSKKLVLIDDVFTTGSTLDECARALLAGGAGAVWAMTVARA